MSEPIHVLLVEDNPADADLTREALTESKFRLNLTVLEDGEKCLSYLQDVRKEKRPDLILLDLNLPRVGGREVLEEVKKSTCLRTIPVVVLTSSDAENDIAHSYDLGANCYITKPIDLASFISIVNSLSDFWFTIVRLPPKLEGIE